MNTDNRPSSYPLRLETETRAKLESIAKANGRSLNAQIVLIVEEWLENGGIGCQPLTEDRVRELIQEELDKRRQ